MEFNVSTSAPSKTTWELTNVDGEKVIIKYNPLRKLLTVDRRNAGFDIKIWTMPIIEAPVLPHNDQISGQMILDKSSLEIFWGDGTTSVTALLFPSSPFDTLVMQSQCDSEKSIIISKVGQK
ncbi:GH32 C-terminal domain-containing protein [Psychrosphaera algicola]|uniref:GH32 C-terminal domain-containing protein n=1 Tax=Psychrosphaera algicola TaxID=3023714 RepID=A0ABT5F7T1_9GAMM|nr:GH32 C-terminal domain-containing protein [Psychrosphaera sp. G1-22]MDC2887595.1 GH32 C-terminal domain-containing protein [Psychrosphaera sp. G1-22]